MKPKRKVVNVNGDTYNKLKSYCKKNGLKIVWVIEKLINEYVDPKLPKM